MFKITVLHPFWFWRYNTNNLLISKYIHLFTDNIQVQIKHQHLESSDNMCYQVKVIEPTMCYNIYCCYL